MVALSEWWGSGVFTELMDWFGWSVSAGESGAISHARGDALPTIMLGHDVDVLGDACADRDGTPVVEAVAMAPGVGAPAHEQAQRLALGCEGCRVAAHPCAVARGAHSHGVTALALGDLWGGAH